MPNVTSIKRHFQRALCRFLEHDVYLLRHDLAERAMTHKVGEYLQAEFSEHNVDCEYNRNMDGAKRVELPPTDNEEDARSVSTYPDIIVHRRGNNDNNLLIVEAKKSNSQYDAGYDERKIRAFSRLPYNYRVGVLLMFTVLSNGDEPSVEWRYLVDGDLSQSHILSLEQAKECLRLQQH